MALPTIAIIGRPNVGKSTLFNRLIGERVAVTSHMAGTTRDRIYHEAEIGTYRCILADTGGMEFGKKKNIEADVQLQARMAVEEADIIFFVMDATQPLTASDRDVARFLRKSAKPILLIAHKADNKKSEEFSSQLYELGLGEHVAVSSIHNLGILDLENATERVLKKMKWKKERPVKNRPVALAVVGKPNVGKSSLVNGLLDEPRLIVSDQPGTTIDATDTPFQWNGTPYVLTDTAGLRRRGKRGQGIERYGVLRALKAISSSDVTCLVLDAGAGLANQDLHVSSYLLDAGKGVIVAVNKSDLLEEPQEEQKKFLDRLAYRMPFMAWAPVVFISALKRKNIFRILELAKNIAAERRKKIPDAEFRLFIRTSLLAHPPTRSGRTITISKAWQSGVEPPTFRFICSRPDLLHFSYRRFLENEIRRRYGFHGTAVRLDFRKS